MSAQRHGVQDWTLLRSSLQGSDAMKPVTAYLLHLNKQAEVWCSSF